MDNNSKADSASSFGQHGSGTPISVLASRDNNTLPKDQHGWNALIFILYPICIVGAYMVIDRLIGISNLKLLSTLNITIMVLATFRIIRLIVADKVFGFARAMFLDTLPDGTEIKPPGGFRRAIAELMECQWCTGVWVGLFVVVVYSLSSIGRFAAIILAISALASLMHIIFRRIGAGTMSNSPHSGRCA